MPLLRHLPTRVTEPASPWDQGDPHGFADLALRELREYSELLDKALVADECRCLELHKITREIRAQAELVDRLIDAAFQPEAF